MVMLITQATIALALCLPVLAHMEMKTPHPLGHELNIFRNKSKPIDTKFNFPLKADGSDYPCKGYLNLIGTPEGQAQVTWDAGTIQFITLEKNSTHAEVMGGTSGGSCQISLSYDNGTTFKVIRSFIGSCPNATKEAPAEQQLFFTIPREAPSGNALLSWSWFNREREMYHNCAVIHIQKGGSGISNLPDMLKADIGNNCTTPKTYWDVLFPDPGYDFRFGDGDYGLRYPQGSGCGSIKLAPMVHPTAIANSTATKSLLTSISKTPTYVASTTRAKFNQSTVASQPSSTSTRLNLSSSVLLALSIPVPTPSSPLMCAPVYPVSSEPASSTPPGLTSSAPTSSISIQALLTPPLTFTTFTRTLTSPTTTSRKP